MQHEITDEMVRDLANECTMEHYDYPLDRLAPVTQERWLSLARNALKKVAPRLRAQGMREAAAIMDDMHGERFARGILARAAEIEKAIVEQTPVQHEITDEMVAAARVAQWHNIGNDTDKMRAALEAVAPRLRAQGMEKAANIVWNLDVPNNTPLQRLRGKFGTAIEDAAELERAIP